MAKAPAKAAKAAKGGKATKKKSFKKKEKRVVHTGTVHVQATFNNTIVTIADQEGNTISWSSAGSLGFRGSRKGTPFAAQQPAGLSVRHLRIYFSSPNTLKTKQAHRPTRPCAPSLV